MDFGSKNLGNTTNQRNLLASVHVDRSQSSQTAPETARVFEAEPDLDGLTENAAQVLQVQPLKTCALIPTNAKGQQFAANTLRGRPFRFRTLRGWVLSDMVRKGDDTDCITQARMLVTVVHTVQLTEAFIS